MSEINNENESTPLAVDPIVESPVVEEAVVEAPVVEAPVVEVAPEVEPEAPKQEVVERPVYGAREEVQGVGVTAGGAIGTTVSAPAPRKTFAQKDKPKEEKIALYSTKNVTWAEVGKVYRGYNIVPVSAADKWLTRDHVRVATPEEVAKEFGK
jgi:hypothetical protein